MKPIKKVKYATRKNQSKNNGVANIKFTLPRNINSKFKKEAKRQKLSNPLLLKNILDDFFEISKKQNLFFASL